MLQTKICVDCNIEKTLPEFSADKRSKSGTTCRCKSCTKIKASHYYKENQEFIKTKQREKYQPKGKPSLTHLYDEATFIGAKLLEHLPQPGYGLYELSCGHTGKYRYCHVRDENVSCRTCSEEEIAFQAMFFGLTLNLDHNPNKTSGGYRNYTLGCGHTKDIRTVHVSSDNFKCKTCQELKNKGDAENNSLVLLGKSSDSDPNYRSYLLPCGCVRNIKTTAAASGIWTCRNCNAGYFQRKSNIYLLRFKTETFSWLKLGFSYSVEDRVRDYKLTVPFSSEVLFLKKMEKGQDALLVEKSVHKNLKGHKLSKTLMKSFHSKSGYTECYKDGLESIIIKEIEEVLEQYGKETENQQGCQSP